MSQTSITPTTLPHTLVARQAPPPPSPAALSTAAPRTGPLRNSNPRGNPNASPRCGAKSRTSGCPCRAPAMPNGRCRLHGGKSTGPRTAEGLARLAAAHTTHGNSTFEARNAYRHERIVARRGRVLAAALDVHAYLPTDIRTRFDRGADDLAAPPYPTQPPCTPTPAAPPGAAPPTHVPHITRDPRGRFAAPPQPKLSATKAERAAARAERALLAPLARRHQTRPHDPPPADPPGPERPARAISAAHPATARRSHRRHTPRRRARHQRLGRCPAPRRPPPAIRAIRSGVSQCHAP
jgi:hypothetical protein